MAWKLREEDLLDLARGAALLGTGGGGDPHVGRLLVAEAMKETGPITILDPDDLADDDFIIPTAQMGAPTVVAEKIPAGTESESCFLKLEEFVGRKARATMPIECGGVNSMIPLHLAARLGLPVVDADGMGRAFPELQMETFSVYGINGSPLTLAGENGETVVIETGSDNVRMERFARVITVQLGGVAHIADFSMTGADVKRTAVPRTLTLALSIGRALREAREANRDPLDGVKETLSNTIYTHMRELFTGKVMDVERSTDGAFVRGRAVIQELNGPEELVLGFQNENLTAHIGDRLVAIVPDLICVVEDETGEPITTEQLRYGQRVRVIGISTPDMMRTPKALDTFGPQAFGLDEKFVPLEEIHPEG